MFSHPLSTQPQTVPRSCAALGYSLSVDNHMPIRTQKSSKLLACLATCFTVFSTQSITREVALETPYKSKIHKCLPQALKHHTRDVALGSSEATSFIGWLVVSLFMFILGPVSSSIYFILLFIEGYVNTWLPLLLWEV